MLEPVITIDIDWAPDHMIEAMAYALIDARVKATWFVTHTTPTLRLLRAHSALFELGIHPNFRPNSTHGQTAPEVLAHCLAIVPEARSVRMHGLLQSTALLDDILHAGLQIDASLFLPRATGLRPVDYWWSGARLVRIPFIWEDDYEFHTPDPIWNIAQLSAAGGGLRVLNFHPVHVFLNSSSPHAYDALRARSDNYLGLEPDEASKFRQSGLGAATMFHSVVTSLYHTGGGRTISGLVDLKPSQP